jgi:hypothetical protein
MTSRLSLGDGREPDASGSNRRTRSLRWTAPSGLIDV